MKKVLIFAGRNAKEMLRDALTLFFGIAFPIILLLLLSAIQANIPVDLFEIEKLAPGIACFGLSFISLFSGLLISKDRTSSFLVRLFSSPLTPLQFILGYTLPLIPMAIAQSAVCFAVSLLLGLKLSFNILLSIVVILPTALLYIAIGLLVGSLLNDKQVGVICGALLTNITAWLSGIWFDLSLVGGTFEKIANALPFVHSVNAAQYAISGEYGEILPELAWVGGYAIVTFIIAAMCFGKKMKS